MDVKNIKQQLDEMMRLMLEVIKRQVPKLYNNKELAKYLGVTEKMLRKYRDEDGLVYARIRNQYFYYQDDVENFINNHKIEVYAGKNKKW